MTGAIDGVVADAFSATAPRYDAMAVGHPHLDRLRGQVHDVVRRHVAAGSDVLELNAGTGLDAVALAQAGYRVHATDIAPGMLARIPAKAAAAGVADRITVEQRSFLELDGVPGAPFDAVFSDLGGLNCTSDLGAVASGIEGVLRPGGVAIVVLMPPVCLWELAEVLRGRFRLATRRLRPGGTVAHLEGRRFPVHYPSPRAARRAFGPAWTTVEVRGLSVLTPTAESQRLAVRHRRVYRVLAWLDDRAVTHRPWRGWGDFYVLVLRLGGER